MTAKQNEFFEMMETSLQNENRNLQDHNVFLVSQIKALFEREKRYVDALKRSKQQNQQLMTINE